MSFYIIDKHDSLQIVDNFFLIYSKKFNYKLEPFNSESFNPDYDFFLFVYDYDDLFEYLNFTSQNINIKAVIMNKFILKHIKSTKNLDFVYIYDFVIDLKKYIQNLDKI